MMRRVTIMRFTRSIPASSPGKLAVLLLIGLLMREWKIIASAMIVAAVWLVVDVGKEMMTKRCGRHD